MERFTVRLKSAREQAGFTQEQLAEKIGVTRQAVSRWEQGHTQPDMEMLVVLSEALQIEAEFLTFGKQPNTYTRFQKKHKVCAIAAFSCGVIILLLMIFLEPYLKKLVHTNYDFDGFLYFWLFRMLLPPAGCFALGFGAVAFVSLFFNACLRRRWRITVLVLGLIAIAPSFLVIMDDALAMWIDGYSAHITFALYMRTVSFPAVQALLFRLFPIIAGVFIFLGFQKESK